MPEAKRGSAGMRPSFLQESLLFNKYICIVRRDAVYPPELDRCNRPAGAGGRQRDRAWPNRAGVVSTNILRSLPVVGLPSVPRSALPQMALSTDADAGQTANRKADQPH